MLAFGAAIADDQDQSAGSPDATFKSLDRDTDERLSKTEVAKDKMLTEHFTAVDADGDGYLTERRVLVAHEDNEIGEEEVLAI